MCSLYLFIYLFPEALKLFPADKESNFILKYLICTNVCLISLVIDNVTETQTNGTDPRTEKLFCIWGAYHSLASLFKCRRSHFLWWFPVWPNMLHDLFTPLSLCLLFVEETENKQKKVSLISMCVLVDLRCPD